MFFCIFSTNQYNFIKILFSKYAIQSINKSVFNVFKSIKISDNKLLLKNNAEYSKYKNKLETILNILNSSLIYNFQGYENIDSVQKYLNQGNIIVPSLKYQLGDYKGQLKTFDINIQKEEEKENIIKWHLNLQFDKIINKIKTSEGSQDYNTFEIAYGSYLIGIDDFKKTYLILKTIYEQNKNETDENKINRFLSKFNQKRLYNLISGHYWFDDREDILSELRSIDLDEYIAELDFTDKDIRKAIIEIKEDKLFNTSNDKISDYNENIKKAYKLYKNGGTQLGAYYQDFDYDNFQAEWLLYWQSEAYLKRFSQIKEIGIKIKSHLKENFNKRLAEIYFKYFDE